MKKILTLLIVLVICSVAVPTYATGLREQILTETQQAADDTFETSINPESALTSSISRFINVMVGVLGTIAVILFLYAGFVWLTAGGNEDRVKTAKKIIIRTTVGLLIVAFAYSIASFFIRFTRDKPRRPKKISQYEIHYTLDSQLALTNEKYVN